MNYVGLCEDAHEYVSLFLEDQAYQMACVCYGENHTEEELEECRETLLEKWGLN